MRGFDFRTADIESGVAVAFALMTEQAEDEEELEQMRTELYYRPTSLAAAVSSTVLEGDEIVPTVVPSWWSGDEEAFSEAQGAAAFFRKLPKGGGD